MPEEPQPNLTAEIERLVRAGQLGLADLSVDAELLRELGFVVAGNRVSVPDVERLEAAAIRRALTERAAQWLAELTVYPVIGSTSTLLLERGRSQNIDGVVALAELQLDGRGRRGRRWLSPFAGNLALSLGVRLPLAPAQIGGISLCVGLALLDRLERLGVAGLALKWPNDVLLHGRKLAGILIDVLQDGPGVQLVVGVGVNVRLPAAALGQIDQPVADLSATKPAVARNELAGALISGISAYAADFAARGFEPMRSVFDAHHAFHGQDCRILQGRTSSEGVVRGVGSNGELLLETEQGVEAFGAGEVSLRR